MDSRADEKVKDMFRVLGKMINKEMWDRTVIVLTCTNFFLQDREIKKSLNKEEIIKSKIEDFKGHIHGFLSSTLKKDTIDKIPFCIAGEEDKKKLPTTHDWIRELWGQCLYRCKEDVRNFLSLIEKCQITLMETGPIYGGTAVGAVVGGAIGGAAGSIVPGTGNIIGAAAGAVIGAGVGATISGVALAVKHKKKEQPSGTEQKN
uniref:AIG1-type G domain-containing protein n=1 Tax=Amphimedon queenslandica TaxID=400682 RepID=A0A1X7SZI1_AMPQE